MKRKEEKEIVYTPVDAFEILRVKDARTKSGGCVYFDIKINGVTIYGCRVVEGQKTDFIGYPSQKGNDGKWYNIVYVPLADADQKLILDAVEAML